MVQVTKDNGYARYGAMRELLAKRQQRSVNVPGQTSKEPKGREVHDTVEISGGGKIVNLARGYDLAKEVRAEKDPAKVREMVKAGSADIKRIGRLFQEVFVTLRSVFGGRRY